MIGVRWLGHATVVVDLDGVRLLTDPLLRRHAGLLRRVSPMPHPADWAETDAVLLSHLHHDHADLPSLRLLEGVPVLGSEPVARWLRGKELSGRGLGDDWAPVTDTSPVEVRLVEADHHSRPMPHRPDDAHGFLLRGPSGVVWFAGDTAAYAGMEHLTQLAGRPIDVALLPIHGWGPRLSAGHLDVAGAADVCRRLGIRHVVPVHHGTLHPLGFHLASLDWMHAPGRGFADAVATTSPLTTVVELAPMGPGWTP